MLNYPILIEVCGQERETDHPSCLYRADYLQGPTLAQDELRLDWDPLFVSGTSEELEAHFTPEGAISFLWSRRRPRQLYRLEREGEVPRRLVEQMLRLARFSPDGRQIAYLAPDSERGANWDWALWTCDSEGSGVQRVPTPGVPVRFLDYSPDGRWLWLSLWSYREPQLRGLYRFERATGHLLQEAVGDYQEFCVSPDGQRLVFIGGRGEQCVGLYDVATGREKVLRWISQESLGLGESDLLGAHFSPDGQRIFYSVHHYETEWSLSQLCASTPDGQSTRILWEEEAPARLVVPRVIPPAPRELELAGAGRLTRKLP